MASARSKKSITKTAGNWDPKDWPVYFAAVTLQLPETINDPLDRMLIAVNEVETETTRKRFAYYIRRKVPIFLDSGVYTLAVKHSVAHGLSMDQALSIAPADLDGFDALFERYVEITKGWGDKLWGYIEIDAGGRANKIKTRAKLEALGLRPIPVYHPFNDGWDYFDYLAQRYDRICFGNVVMADAVTRKRLVATAWERRRKYPHLWIHLLGLTPSELTVAFPMNSCDSSTWIAPSRWGRHSAKAATSAFGSLDRQFVYKYGQPHGDKGYFKACNLCAYDATILSRSMKVIAEEQRQHLGADIGGFL